MWEVIVKPLIIEKDSCLTRYSLIPLPLKIAAPLESDTTLRHGREYCYKLEEGGRMYGDTQICPETMRPYHRDPKTCKVWREQVENTIGPVEEVISAFRYYLIAFGVIYKKLSIEEKNTNSEKIGFPNLKQVLIVIEKGERNRGFFLLPKDFPRIMQSIIDDYEKAREMFEIVSGQAVTPEIFKKMIGRSQSLASREGLENLWTNKTTIMGCVTV
jgi:hypothetical protein